MAGSQRGGDTASARYPNFTGLCYKRCRRGTRCVPHRQGKRASWRIAGWFSRRIERKAHRPCSKRARGGRGKRSASGRRDGAARRRFAVLPGVLAAAGIAELQTDLQRLRLLYVLRGLLL